MPDMAGLKKLDAFLDVALQVDEPFLTHDLLQFLQDFAEEQPKAPRKQLEALIARVKKKTEEA